MAEVTEVERGQYVTDGGRLFRVIARFDPLLGQPAELENCRTLEVRTYSADELVDMELRRVPRAGEPSD